MADRVRMIHSVTGTIMLVPAELVDEYVKAGHKVVAERAAVPPKPAKAKDKK